MLHVLLVEATISNTSGEVSKISVSGRNEKVRCKKGSKSNISASVLLGLKRFVYYSKFIRKDTDHLTVILIFADAPFWPYA